MICCGNWARWHGQTLTHPIVELLRWPLWPVIQCEMLDQWPRWSDKRLFNIYFVLCHGYSITVIVLTQSTLMQPVNGSQRHLWAVQCHSFNEFPITCYTQGVYKVRTLFFFKLGFYTVENVKFDYWGTAFLAYLMNNCFCPGFYAVIIYTLKFIFVCRIHWIFSWSFLCV